MSDNAPHLFRSRRRLTDQNAVEKVSTRLRGVLVRSAALGLGFAGFSLAGTHITEGVGTTVSPKVVNRREKSGEKSFVLELAPPSSGPVEVFHRSHRSHSSHRSHYSHYSSARPSTPRPTRPTSPSPSPSSPSASADLSGSVAEAEKLESVVIEIDEIDQKGRYIFGKTKTGQSRAFLYEMDTLVRVLSPSKQTSRLEVLLAFTGALPFKASQEVLIHWEVEDGTAVAKLVTILEKR